MFYSRNDFFLHWRKILLRSPEDLDQNTQCFDHTALRSFLNKKELLLTLAFAGIEVVLLGLTLLIIIKTGETIPHEYEDKNCICLN